MAEQYFIKRGKTVKGPFTVEKLLALNNAKKLKANDGISQSTEGPWESISGSYKAKQSSEQPNPSPAEPSPKTVTCEDCGGVVSRRAQSCPHCGAPIGQSEDQVPSAVAEYTDDEQFGAYYDDDGYEDDYVDPHPLSPRRKQSNVTKPVSTTPSGSGLIAAGYICGGLSLICLPPGLGLAGLVIGIVNITKGHTGHGIAQIIISVTCGILGMVMSALVMSL